MTITQLKQKINSLVGSGSILLRTDLAFIPNLPNYLSAHLDNPSLLLENLNFDESSVTLSGSVEFLNATAGASIQFFRKNNSIQFILEISMPSDWELKDAFPDFEEDDFPALKKCQFVVASTDALPTSNAPTFKTADGVILNAEQKINKVLSGIKKVLGNKTKLNVSGAFSIQDGFPQMEVGVDLENLIPIGFLNMPMRFIKVVSFTKTEEETYTSSYFRLESDLEFDGKIIPLSANYFGEMGMLTFEADLEDVSVSSLAKINNFFGNGQSLGSSLPSGLSLGTQIAFKKLAITVNRQTKLPAAISIQLGTTKTWNLNADFSVENVEVLFILMNPTKTSTRKILVMVDGQIGLGQNTHILLNANYPDTIVTGELQAGSTIPVADLFEKFLPISSFPNLSITALSMSFQPSARDFNLAGTITNEWGINFGGSTILLREINLEMSKTGSDKMVKIEGLTDMLGYRFRLTGEQPEGENGWRFSGSTALDQTISIKKLIGEILDFFRIEFPLFYPDIVIDYFEVLFSTISKRFKLTANSHSEFEIFNKKFEASTEVIIDTFVDPVSKKRKVSGYLMAEIEIVEGFIFDIDFEMGDESPVISGSLASSSGGDLSLGSFLSAFGLDLGGNDLLSNVAKPVIDTLLNPLKLTSLAFEYDAAEKTITIQGISKDFGNLILVSAINEKTRRRFNVVGLEFPPEFQLSDIPVPELQPVLQGADFMTFQKIGLLLSTAEVGKYAFPPIPQFEEADDEENNSSFLADANMELAKGLTVAAQIDLDDPSANASVSKLKAATGVAKLNIYAGVGHNDLNFKTLLDGGVGFDIGEERMDLIDPFVQVDVLPKFGLQLGGNLLMKFGDTQLLTTGALIISPMEVSGRFEISAHEGDDEEVNHATASGNLLEPLGIHGISLNSIGFIVGATFIPPGIKFGMQAKFEIGTQEEGANELAAILQVIPAAPSPIVNVLLLSFQLQKLSMREAMIVLTNDKSPSMPDFMQSVSFSNVGMFYCSTITTMPDGNTALPGFGFNGSFNILGFKGRAGLMVSTLSGIKGNFQLDPFQIKVGDFEILSVKGNGKRIEETYEKVDGNWVKVNNEDKLVGSIGSEENLPVPETRTELILTEGGPVLEFDSMGPRFLYGSVDIELFGIISTETEIEISKEGFKFMFNYGVSDILNMGFDFAVNWANGDYGFFGHTYFNLDLDLDIDLGSIGDLDLGSIHLDSALDASATIKADTNGFMFKINGSFEFEGTRFDFPELSLDINFGSLKDLPKMIFDHIIKKAAEIFAAIFDFLTEAWEDTKQFFKDAYAETEKVVLAIAEKAEEVAEAAIELAEGTVKEIAETVEKVGQEISKAVTEAKEFAEKVGNEIVEIGKAAQKEFEKVVEAAEVVWEAAKETVKEALKAAEEFIENVGEAIVEIAEDVAQFVKDVGKAIKRQVEKILAAAAVFYNDVVAAAKKAAEYLEKAARELEKLAAAIWDEIEEFFENVGEAIVDVAEDTGEFFEDVGEGIVGALNGY